MQGLSSDFAQFFLVKKNLLISVHNDADNYNRVIGIEQLNAFSCAKNGKAHESNTDNCTIATT